MARHVLWVVAIIVMALGLGFAVANRRRDRIDVVNQRAENAEERSDSASPAGPLLKIIPGYGERFAASIIRCQGGTEFSLMAADARRGWTGTLPRMQPVVTAGEALPLHARDPLERLRVGR